MDEMMRVHMIVADAMSLSKEAGLEAKRALEVIKEFMDIVTKDGTNKLVYNSITTDRYTEHERRVLFYLWGRLTKCGCERTT